MARRRIVPLLALASLAACSGPPAASEASREGAPAGGSETRSAPQAEPRLAQSRVIVVFTHGSGPAAEPDPCHLDTNGWPGTPEVMAALDGVSRAGRTIELVRFCTPSRIGVPLSRIHPDPRYLRF